MCPLTLKQRRYLPALLVLTTGLLLPAHATTVYKTVDKNGVVSFSDAPPTTDQAVETLNVEVAEPSLTDTEQARLEAMRETTDRMAADRMAREKHRAEMRQLAGEQVYEVPASSQAPQYYESNTSSWGYSRIYPRYGWRNPNHRPGYRPKPEHPIVRPPLRPERPGHGYRPTPQRPVYNDYPASLVRKGYDPRVRTVIETGHYPSRQR